MEGVRVDTWVETGSEVTPYYDSLLAKLMVFAPDRPAAIAKLQAALAATQVQSCPQAAAGVAHSLTPRHELRAVLFLGNNTLHAIRSRTASKRCVHVPALCASSCLQLKGIPNNLELCKAIAASEAFAAGRTTTAFLADFPFAPHAAEVVAPGMNTTVQVCTASCCSL